MITNKCGTLNCDFMLSFYYLFSPFERFSIAFERGGKCDLDVQVGFDHWFSQCLCMSAINCSN